MNAVIALLEQARDRNLCTKPFCSTCGSGPFERLLFAVPHLQAELEQLDLTALQCFPDWRRTLRLVALRTRHRLDWEAILDAWLASGSQDQEIIDVVLAFVIPAVRVSGEQVARWIDCAAASLQKQQHLSLLESLIRFHRQNLPDVDAWLALALEKAGEYRPLRAALIESGDLRP
jgi:hypothetical protein